MKNSSPPGSPSIPPDAPTPSVRTPRAVRLGAVVALLVAAILVALVFFGPKGEKHSGAASRPTGGDKVETPATPGVR